MLVDLPARAARLRGEHTFLLHEGKRLGFAEFEAQSNRAAHALLELGVRKGDRVTVALGNSLEWPVVAFGVLKAGAILHTVNPALGARELSYILGHAEPRVIVTDAANAPQLLSPEVGRPASAHVVCNGRVDGTLELASLLEGRSAEPPGIEIRPGDGSTLLYTSGTTGNPKGVLFTHGRTGTSISQLARGLAIGRDDVVIFVGPLFHGNAWSALCVGLEVGCTVTFPKAFRASEFWPLARSTGATAMFTLGTILAILLAQEPAPNDRDHRLRVILGLGSAPIRERFRERFGVQHIVECFGSTDAGVVTLETLDHPPRPGSSGPPLDGVRIRIVDDTGADVPTGSPGEIWIESSARMECYFRDPEQTAAALRDGWFLTGDLGYLDADGWLHFVDRKRDVIRRGGENVSSVLVEKVIREHPAVADVAVIGVRHPVLGQEIKAVVVPSRPVETDELRTFAASKLARFQVPTLWELRDSLPKTATQRVEKYKLRQEHEGNGGPLLG